MFCKVCKDAGKNETEYTSHWVRDAPGPNGKVVCPTLLSTHCKYCKETGHIVKYCPKLKGKYSEDNHPRPNNISIVNLRYKSTPTASQEVQQMEEERRQERARELCSSPPPAPIGQKTNYFQMLLVDEVDEEDDEKTTSVIPTTLKPDYLDIAKSGVENANKEAELQNYKEDLEKNFPTLNPTTSFTDINSKKPTSTSAKSYKDVALTYTFVPKDEKGNPLPSGSYLKICRGCGQLCRMFCDNDWCDGTTPPPQTMYAEEEMEKNKREIEKMKRWEEKRRRNDNTSPPPLFSTATATATATATFPEEEDTVTICSKCIPGKYGCSECYPYFPIPSSSPTPTPTPPPTRWSDVDVY